jgi:hypothetical protein
MKMEKYNKVNAALFGVGKEKGVMLIKRYI